MLLVFVGVSGLAVAAMLLYWTPYQFVVVAGVQGRYFLPALVVGLLAVRTKRTCVSRNADQYAAMWTVFFTDVCDNSNIPGSEQRIVQSMREEVGV